MTPVINPWVFYWLPICDKLIILTVMLSVGGVITTGVTLGIGFDCLDYWDDDKIKNWKRIVKTMTAITLVVIMLVVFIPSEETVTKMILAQNVTYERVEAVSDTVATVYNDIMALFGEVSGG